MEAAVRLPARRRSGRPGTQAEAGGVHRIRESVFQQQGGGYTQGYLQVRGLHDFKGIFLREYSLVGKFYYTVS